MLSNAPSFVLAALLALAHAASAEEVKIPCPVQFETSLKCILGLVGSDETKLIEDKTKIVFHTTCAPDYPLDCFSQFETAKGCYVETRDLLDAPGPLKRQKDLAYATADACFGKRPVPSFMSGLEEIFLPSPIKVLTGNIGQRLWGDGGGKGRLAPLPVAAAILRGLNATTPSPSVENAPEPGRNATGADSGDDGQQKLFGRKDCAPKLEQILCAFKELNKLNDTDPEFKAAIKTLKDGANKCKKELQQRCTPNTPEEQQCVTDAKIPLILAFVDYILDCMKAKGYTLPPLLPRSFPGSSRRPKLLP